VFADKTALELEFEDIMAVIDELEEEDRGVYDDDESLYSVYSSDDG
jgi:hypothetical protein